MDREAMDDCGFNADLEVKYDMPILLKCYCSIPNQLNSGGQLVAITATSEKSCEVPLSGIQLTGPNVRTQQLGHEVTSFVSMTANQPQIFTPSSPIPI